MATNDQLAGAWQSYRVAIDSFYEISRPALDAERLLADDLLEPADAALEEVAVASEALGDVCLTLLERRSDRDYDEIVVLLLAAAALDTMLASDGLRWVRKSYHRMRRSPREQGKRSARPSARGDPRCRRRALWGVSWHRRSGGPCRSRRATRRMSCGSRRAGHQRHSTRPALYLHCTPRSRGFRSYSRAHRTQRCHRACRADQTALRATFG